MSIGSIVQFRHIKEDDHFLDSLISILADNKYVTPSYVDKLGLVIGRQDNLCKVLFFNIQPGKKRIWLIGAHALVRII